jgi:hypothetical protein
MSLQSAGMSLQGTREQRRARARVVVAGDFCPSDRVVDLLLAAPKREILGDLAQHLGRADLSI